MWSLEVLLHRHIWFCIANGFTKRYTSYTLLSFNQIVISKALKLVYLHFWKPRHSCKNFPFNLKVSYILGCFNSIISMEPFVQSLPVGVAPKKNPKSMMNNLTITIFFRILFFYHSFIGSSEWGWIKQRL